MNLPNILRDAVTLVRKENRQCGFILLERWQNATDTLGIQDVFPSHRLPVKLSVTVKTGLDELRKTEAQLVVR